MLLIQINRYHFPHRKWLGFYDLGPNHKIPAIYDEENDIGLSESGAILIYLAELKGQLLPKEDKYLILQWLMFQMARHLKHKPLQD